MRGEHAVDILLVSLGSTEGLRRADDELQDSLRRAGARVAVARPFPQDAVPTMMLTDLLWAPAARDAASKLLEQQHSPARSVIYSTTTAALFWKRPGAIRFDATADGNRPGRHGPWHAPLGAVACAKRRCCCRGAKARYARSVRRLLLSATSARSCCRCPSRLPARRPRSATSQRSRTPRTRRRRVSTACSRRGGAFALSAGRAREAPKGAEPARKARPRSY